MNQQDSYRTSRWIFIRCLALVYAVVFTSLLQQVEGLIGTEGIAPFTSTLRIYQQETLLQSFLRAPGLLWFWQSNTALLGICWSGLILSLALLIGYYERLLLSGLWLCFLSIVSVGSVFLQFQWDILLLETGFLAIFFADNQGSWRCPSRQEPCPILHALLLIVLFKVIFLSGYVKLKSGDLTWRNFTALYYHFYTQPIPNPIAWYIAKLPAFLLQWSVLGMFLMELLAPLLIFFPGRVRLQGAALLILLQVNIAASGNFAYFNLLTLALCTLVLHDRWWAKLLPRALAKQQPFEDSVPFRSRGNTFRSLQKLRAPVSLILCILVCTLTTIRFVGIQKFPKILQDSYRRLAPFRLASTYGVFATMTTERIEIVLEGTYDGKKWEAYILPFQPGPLDRRPPQIAPFHPRLDWQMWFLPFRNCRNNPWFIQFIERLLRNEPSVVDLLEHNPFTKKPPLQIRTKGYRYEFTSWKEGYATGNWWTREYAGTYCPHTGTRSSLSDPRPALQKNLLN